jgi:hypothetical protein
MVLIDEGQAVGEKRHADASPAMFGMSAKEAEVVVRLPARVRRIKSRHEFDAVIGPWPQLLDHQLMKTLFFRYRQFGAARWYPDRRGLAPRGDPGFGVSKRTFDEKAPKGSVMVGSPIGSRQRSAP